MLKNITLKDTKKFSNISGDRNKIHLSEKIAKRYFFRKPIVHGANLLIIGLIKFLDKKKLSEINHIKINFKNFCLNNENFFVKILQNNFKIQSKLNIKIETDLKFQNHKDNNLKKDKLDSLSRKIIKFYELKNKMHIFLNYFKHIIYISMKIGNFSSKENCLIHSIVSEKNKSQKPKIQTFKVKKIVKSMFSAGINYNGYNSKAIFSKLLKLNYNLKKFRLDKNIQKKIDNKKILIFGASGDISKAVLFYLKKTKTRVFEYSIKKEINFLNLQKYILNKKPDFIFYFSSPQIINDNLSNKVIFNIYNDIYFKKYKIILDILDRNNLKTKVFYPSTFALKNVEKYKRIKSYLCAKKKVKKYAKSTNTQNIFIVIDFQHINLEVIIIYLDIMKEKNFIKLKNI